MCDDNDDWTLPPLGGMCEYEKEREANILRNRQVLQSLGLGGGNVPLTVHRPRQVSRPSRVQGEVRRRSHRTTPRVTTYCEEEEEDITTPRVVTTRSSLSSSLSQPGPLDNSSSSPYSTGQKGPLSSHSPSESGPQEEKRSVKWFAFPEAPTTGNIGLTLSSLPPGLLKTLGPHVDDLAKGDVETQTGQPLYWGVTVQSGKSTRPDFKGWQVQSWNPVEGKIVRLGLCDESTMGAVMVALADIDERLFLQSDMYAFLYYMAAHGQCVLDRWVEEMGDRLQVINPHGRRRKSSGSKDKKKKKKTPLPHIPTTILEERKKRRVVQALDAAKQHVNFSPSSSPPLPSSPDPSQSLYENVISRIPSDLFARAEADLLDSLTQNEAEEIMLVAFG